MSIHIINHYFKFILQINILFLITISNKRPCFDVYLALEWEKCGIKDTLL